MVTLIAEEHREGRFGTRIRDTANTQLAIVPPLFGGIEAAGRISTKFPILRSPRAIDHSRNSGFIETAFSL